MRRDAIDGLTSEADALVWVALGAASLSRCLEELLTSSGSAKDSLDDDDPLLLAALGAVSLRRTVERWLHEAKGPEQETPLPSDAPPLCDEDLLR
jgi:hypothetical protein